jgi:hypothetical protein
VLDCTPPWRLSNTTTASSGHTAATLATTSKQLYGLPENCFFSVNCETQQAVGIEEQKVQIKKLLHVYLSQVSAVQ